jgi:trehalose utilization protein
MIHVTVWNEYLHEKECADIAAIYPQAVREGKAA